MTLGQLKDAVEALSRRLHDDTEVISTSTGVIIMGGSRSQANPIYLTEDELSKLDRAGWTWVASDHWWWHS